MNRTERLLDLITYLLNAPDPVSWQEIKNHFPDDYARGQEESNQRKFERDKAELLSLGIPIDYLSGADVKKEGYIIRKGRLFLPEIEFTPQESSLLMLSASAVLENDNFPYREQLESALDKISSLQQRFTAPPPEIKITYGSRKRNPSWVRDIQDAIDRKKYVEIVYHAFTTGQTVRRKVNPYGLIFRRGSWTLIGWDHLRQDLRSFVLTRIKDLEINPRKPGTPDYEVSQGFSLRNYQNQQPWELDIHEPISVTLSVAKHRLPELEPQLLTAEPLEPGVFALNVTNSAGFISWALSQRTDVKVLEPVEIQHRIKSVLENLT